MLGFLSGAYHFPRGSLVCGVVLRRQLPGVPLSVLALLPAERLCRFRVLFLCWVLLPTLLLPASTLLTLMDLLGSVRRDGLSALASLPLCRFPPPPPCRRSSCRVFPLVQAKLVSPFLWFTAVPYMLLVSPEGVFIVTNCMLTLPGTLARVFLVTTDGFSFFGPEPSHLGSLARVMIRLYTQDPSCTLFCLVVRSPFHVPWLPPLASLVSRGTLSLEQMVWPQLVVALIRVWTFTASL